MAIYFIENTATGNVKIGFTSGLAKWRLASLQTGCDGALSVLLVVPGDEKAERSWHSEFAPLRIRGEWFRNEDPLASRIHELRYLWPQDSKCLVCGAKSSTEILEYTVDSPDFPREYTYCDGSLCFDAVACHERSIRGGGKGRGSVASVMHLWPTADRAARAVLAQAFSEGFRRGAWKR